MAAWIAARALPVPGLVSVVDELWHKLVARHRVAFGAPGAIRTALTAREAMAVVGALEWPRKLDLASSAAAFTGGPVRARAARRACC